VSAIPSTVDLSPAAERRLEMDEATRTWQNAPILARLAALEQMMAAEFEELQAATQRIGGEGGEIDTAATRIIAAANAAIGSLNGIVTGLQQQLADATGALADANASLAAGRQVAASTTETLQRVQGEVDAAEQKLNDAADALQPAPEPAPAS
jgi:chromosome segregation ATPase